MNVKEIIPKEGVTGWSDSWMLSKKAKHPICAYKWMNYTTTPETQVKVVDVTGYSPANQKTCEVLGPQRCEELHVTDAQVLRHDQVLADAGIAHQPAAVGRCLE